MRWYVYMVKCADESVYTGISTDIERRIKQHNSKKGAKSLRGKLPVTLIHKEAYNSQPEAAKREREIKGWRREKKVFLIQRASPIKGLS